MRPCRRAAAASPGSGSIVPNVTTLAGPGSEVRDAAAVARETIVVRRAVALAEWIGTGSLPVTAGKVLRRADVPAAGAAIGVAVPAKLRTMTDIADLHRPWSFAIAAGILQVADGQVSSGPALQCWPPDGADLLEAWLAGVRAVCAAEARQWDSRSVRMLALALLTLLSEDGAAASPGPWEHHLMPVLYRLCDHYDQSTTESVRASRYHNDDRSPGNGWLVPLLAELGAVDGEPARPVLTQLGRWALRHLADDLPGLADPGIAASQMIAAAARFDDAEQRDHVAWGWLAERDPAAAAREILAAAETMSPLHRSVAVGVLARFDGAMPAFQPVTTSPTLGQHARAILDNWGLGCGDADQGWLAVEAAAAALEAKGPDEALTLVWECLPGDDLAECLAAARATGHPDAVQVAASVAEFAASGALRSTSQAAELKITLTGFRPPRWRRVQLPVTATLADLHAVIQVVFGWDGDHLHLFEVKNKTYSSSWPALDGAGDEAVVRLKDALAPGERIGYVYDLGEYWRHEITLERVLALDPDRDYPLCVSYKGDSPVEYWCEDDLSDPGPFDVAEVNRLLAGLFQ